MQNFKSQNKISKLRLNNKEIENVIIAFSIFYDL